LLAGALGFVFQRNGVALYPYLDSFKSVIGVFAIFLMIYGVVDAWLYWAATYAIAVLLFMLTDQYIIAFMYLGYLLFSLYTFKLWSDKRVQ
jgi:nicotinamide mononucleotide transporter PnuC